MNRDLLTYIGQQPRLPAGYREVEYIESTGEQWIDTGVVPNQDTSVLSEWVRVSGGNACGFFGATKQGWTANSYGCNGSGSIYDNYNSDRTTNISGASLDGKRIVYDKRKNETRIEHGESLYELTQTYVSFSCDRPMFVFAHNYQGNPIYYVYARLYYFKTWDDNTLVRSYVPCVRISDSKPGMYDLCGSVCGLTGTPFYVNSGTGADFTWGEKEKKPDFFPTRGLVFWNPLDKWRTKATTGQTMTYNGSAANPVLPTETTYKDVPCCLFNANSYWHAIVPVKESMKAYSGTLSCWVASASKLVKWLGSDGVCVVRGNNGAGIMRYGVEWQNNQLNLSAGKHDNATTFNTYVDVPNDTGWHHFVVELECDAGWVSTNWRDTVYVDGVRVRTSVSNSYVNNDLNAVCIGQHKPTGSYGFHIAGVRLYDRLLHPDEIAVLAHEFTPIA